MSRFRPWLAIAPAASGFIFSSAFGYRVLVIPILTAVLVPALALAVLHRLLPDARPWSGLLVGALLWFPVCVVVLFPGRLVAHGPAQVIATAASAATTVWGRLGATLPASAVPAALIAPFTVTWAATTLAMSLRIQARTGAAALLPLAAGVVSAMLLCAPQTAGAILPAIVFTAAAAADLSTRNHVTTLSGSGPKVGAATLTIACVVAATFVATSQSWLAERIPYDPHRHAEAPLPSTVLDPLAQEAMWASEPRTILFRTTTAAPNGWILAYLDSYNGTQWQPSGQFIPAASLAYLSPNRVGSQDLARQQVLIAAMTGPYLPLPRQVVSISGIPVQYSSHDVIALAQSTVHSGMAYSTAVARSQPDTAVKAGSQAPDAAAQSVPGGMPTAVNSLVASVNAGLPASATPLQRVTALARQLTSGYVYRPGDAADQTFGGLQRLVTAKQGSAAAFATIFAVAARTMGMPTRIAVGFASGHRQADGSHIISGADARVWDEVYATKVGWVAFNVLPKATLGRPDGLAVPAGSTPRPSSSPSPKPVASGATSPSPAPVPSRSVHVQAGKNGGLAVPRIAWAAILGAFTGLCLFLRCYQVLIAPNLRRRKARGWGNPAERTWGAWEAAAAEAAWRSLVPPGTAAEPGWLTTELPPRARAELAPTLGALSDLAFQARYGEPTDTEADRHEFWRKLSDEEASRAWQLEAEIAARSRDLAGWPGSICAQLVPWTGGVRSELVRKRNTPTEAAD